jgi:nitrogen fixation/metabolism regulation signal transduction histidine kinase
MLPVVIRDLSKLTNRFAGPVYRLRQAMSELREGKFRGNLKFRDNDYWQEMASEFNELAKQMEAWKLQAMRAHEEEPEAVGVASE